MKNDINLSIPAEMAWLDMETTGLDANKDVPLEVGIILTDNDLNIRATWDCVVFELTDHYGHVIELAKKHEIVGPMHDASGLWIDIERAKTLDDTSLTREEADDEIFTWLKEHDAKDIPMCGSSTGSLDRPFSLVHFPRMNEFLSYRNIDSSTIKELCKRWNPDLFNQLLPLIGSKSDAGHRAIDDAKASIRELGYYRDNFFFIP